MPISNEGFIISFFIVLNVLFWVIVPFLTRDDAVTDDASLDRQRGRLLAYYERVLRNIRDLDEDHATGKMPTADYEFEREEWMGRGIKVLRMLDKLDAQDNLVTDAEDDAAIDEAIDDVIEAAIAAKREQAILTDEH